MRQSFWPRRIAMFILIGALAVTLFSGLVMLLWNNILVNVVNVHAITFWQALGILVLSKILFGGFFGGRGRRYGYWKQRMRDKWNNMTPEEQEKYKQHWQSRCGWGYGKWENESQGPQTETKAAQ